MLLLLLLFWGEGRGAGGRGEGEDGEGRKEKPVYINGTLSTPEQICCKPSETESREKVVQLNVEAYRTFTFSTVSSQWDLSHAKFGLLYPGKASFDRVALPNQGCMLDVLVFP